MSEEDYGNNDFSVNLDVDAVIAAATTPKKGSNACWNYKMWRTPAADSSSNSTIKSIT